ncbi:MAG: OmpA family protein [Deltaproteobacteria bacterium]|nr:OmpA family protein [Deltaproteobacteria bacterium]
MRLSALLFLLSGFVVMTGCASTRMMRAGIADGQLRVQQIEANGGRKCAPRELAVARAQIQFALLEISQGMGSRAREHYDIAMRNLVLAEKKTVPGECGDAPVNTTPDCVDRDRDFICEENDQCPRQAEDYDGIEDSDGCPEDQDTDMDGILDSIDQCITDKEDLDGFEDEDGCPDLDNDLDSVPDATDECPIDAEDPDSYEDSDGCPDNDNDADTIFDLDDECPNTAGVAEEKGCPKKYEGVKITKTRIEINQKIFFAYNKAKIMNKSYPILAMVAKVLRENPDISLSIEGHTDSKGKDAYNKKLSTKRAKAVVEHLVSNGGVARNRLRYVGWGEEKPIDSNLTEEGQAANRRVEFVRTDSAH